jgi:hypothetical protein
MEMAESHIESLTNSYEEIFLDHEIYIQPDRDPYRGGFEWSVCREGVELDAGLEFSIDDALKKAQGVVTALKQVVSPAP